MIPLSNALVKMNYILLLLFDIIKNRLSKLGRNLCYQFSFMQLRFHEIIFLPSRFQEIFLVTFRYKSPSPGLSNAPPLPPHQPRSAVHHPFLQAANFPGNQHRESGPNFQGVRHSESGPNFQGNRHSENGQGAILETIKV